MSRDEFESAIANGIPLMILDNLVLNIAEYINNHPGGRFLMRHNIGTDISKYFYGGYCLEGNQGPIPAFGHPHSTVARMIINDLIVANYEDDIPPNTLVCKQIKENSTDNRQSGLTQNTNTSTILLQSVDHQKHFQSYYSDLRMIGKHFMIRSFANINVTRHYTICNVMEPKFYTLMNDALRSNDVERLNEHLSSC
jgi:hypothetical protein